MADTNGAGDVQLSDELLASVQNPPKSQTFELVDESPDGQDELQTDGSLESLADEQEDEQQESEQLDDVLADMRLYDFTKAAGVKLQEFYDKVMIPVDGVDVPIGKALNDMKSVKSKIDALSRERDDLREKLSQSAVQVPTQQHSPEAMALLKQAEQWEQHLLNTDWSQFDAATAASQKIDLKTAIDQQRQMAYQKETEFQTQRQQQTIQAREECDRQTLSRIPAWSDPTVKAKDEQQMHETASSYGFSRQEVEQWLDPRARQMLYDLSQHRTRAAQIKKGATRIRKVGKTLGAGSRAGLPNDKKSLAQVRDEIRKAAGNEEELSRIRQTRELGELPTAQQHYPKETR